VRVQVGAYLCCNGPGPRSFLFQRRRDEAHVGDKDLDASPGLPLAWTVLEPGLHRATRNGRTVGYVVQAGAAFIAFDGLSTPVGSYKTLDAARRLGVERAISPRPRPRWWESLANSLASVRGFGSGEPG
jgi:hypothetical protein